MLTTNDALSNAFQLLVSTVRDFYSKGRPCVGAALKPEINRRANFGFNEQFLGFAKFGDFLRAAEANGLVQLSTTPGGDLGIWPAGVEVTESASRAASNAYTAGATAIPPHSTQLVQVRQDLWDAFTSFAGRWFYDPVADIARRDSVGDPELQDHTGAISIPSARERTIEWMRSFAEIQDSATKSRLLAALTGDAAPYQFTNAVRAEIKLARAWRKFHIQQVLAAIEAWAASNRLRPKNVSTPLFRSVHPSFAPTNPTSSGQQFPAPQASLPPQSTFQSPTSRIELPQPRTSVRRPDSSTYIARLSDSPLTGRIEALVDELIEELVKLRGYIQIARLRE